MFNISTVKLINILICSLGIGVCTLCYIQAKTFIFMKKDVRVYFRIFFLAILVYITSHLVREIMEGMPGAGFATALRIVTFIEIFVAGCMAYQMSMMIIATTESAKRIKPLLITLAVLLGIHAIIMLTFGNFRGYIFYFDADNIYHRGPLFLLSNITPLVMLIFDSVLMIRYRKKIEKKIYIAFWNYLVTPFIAIMIQSFFYGFQLIIFGTVGAAVVLFGVIVAELGAQYQKQMTESSRLETELTLANRIQADMLPNIFPAFPDRKEFDIYASMMPAKEVGGDFYDFFFIDHDHLGIVMADVSGKGVPAALFMMISKILVQNFAITGHSPKQVLERVNKQICSNNREEMFVTVWLGVLDVTTGHLVAANAGHEYPALKKKDGSFELIKSDHGLPVGAMPGSKYKEYELQLEPDSKLFLYTDGVAEAANSENELYGTDRMIEALRESENANPKEILEAVDRSLEAFVKDAPQVDDVTMLCLHFNGEKS